MLFVTPEFAIFFCIAVLVFFSIPHRLRWVWLLITSYYFYASWNANYLLLIIFSTLVDYVVGLQIGNTPETETRKRRLLLLTSICVNLGVLFVFKYFNFFMDSATSLSNFLGYSVQIPNLDVLLPVGISFYTFQSMSYTIDVYRGKLEPEKHFGIFATFIAFFPQLVAGPIERAPNMLPQFYANHEFDYNRAVEGFRLILWGTFQKVAVADRLGVIVNSVYGSMSDFSGPTIWFATVLFAIQVYCDFSAYSDIAIGVAKVLGFDLMRNFRQPFFAESLSKLWSRWHISLTTWFNDYVLRPLGGLRVNLKRRIFNVLVVFFLSGLWHGAGWTFIIWGTLQGVIIGIEYALRAYRIRLLPKSMNKSLQQGIRIFVTFSLFVVAGLWFRASTVQDALYVYTHTFDFTGKSVMEAYASLPLSPAIQFAFTMLCLGGLIVYDVLDAYYLRQPKGETLPVQMSTFPIVVRWTLYFGITSLVAMAIMLSLGSSSDFIYFQF